jgi:hypothetical protein
MRWISDIVCIPEVVIWVVGYPSIICIVKIIMTLSHFLVQRRNSGHDFSFSMIAWLMLFMFSFRHLVAMWYYERRLLWGMLLLWEVLLSGLCERYVVAMRCERYVVAMRGIALWEVYCCYELCERYGLCERYVVVAMGSVNGMLLLWALWEVCCCYERYCSLGSVFFLFYSYSIFSLVSLGLFLSCW